MDGQSLRQDTLTKLSTEKGVGMPDREVNLVLNESTGFSQRLSIEDAQILFQKLIEFQHKEGATDVSLNQFRSLGVKSTGKSIQFTFFQHGQNPDTFTWHTLNQNQTQEAINQLRNGLPR